MKLPLATAALALAGCIPGTIAFAPTGQPHPFLTAKPVAAVPMLLTPPACPFTEVGLLETEGAAEQWSLAHVVLDMRKVAAAIGADAVLMAGHTDSSSHSGSVSHGYSAAAIVYTRPGSPGACVATR